MMLTEIDAVVAHYKACAIWASTHTADDDSDPVQFETVHKDWSAEALKEIEDDCRAFCEANIRYLDDWEASQVGHSFYLSRNGHGAGFFDYPDKYGRKLQQMAGYYGTSEPYLGDDGKTYLSH